MRIIKLLQLALILFFLHCTNTTNSNSPKITRGNIDFHSWNFSKQGNVKLNGEWFFFPNKILKTEEILEAFFKEDRAFYWEFMGGELKKIPGEWNEYTNPTTKEKMGGSGFASYVISVKNINFEGPTGLEIKEEGTAYEFFICVKKPNPSCNLISKNGIVGKSRTSSVPQIFHTTNLLPKLPEDSIFVMNISNFHHREGGFWEEITIGDFLSLIRIKDYRASISFISLGIILVMGFYHLGLFSQRREDKASLFFSLF
ncbi:MAG: hypothetical protein KDK36_02585, partial [Leptospiraceae bacterium]|nr:hypothetical protein [Leptospiraceae bacterium]